MNAINRFFRKYLWISILIFSLFIVINLVGGMCFLTVVKTHTIDADKEISEIARGISQNGHDQITINENARKLLSEKQAFAMILDEVGNVIWEYDMPEKLPESYSVSDVAKFSHWYLEDYPVLVKELSFGLLVVGYPPDNIFGISMVKLYYVTDSGFLGAAVIGGIFLLLANILLVVWLFWNHTRKIEREITPILRGIEAMSQGQSVELKEKGELAEINEELMHASQYIQKKDRARAEWINGISHDVRTPLSMIMGYAGEMEEDGRNTTEVRKQAGIIRSQAEKIKQLITDLNLVSKLEYAMQPLRKEKVDLLELGRQVISEFLNAGIEDKYEIEYDTLEVTQDVLFMEGDTFLLKRMLNNLIQNSISHNPQGCHIMVSVRTDEKGCVYCVSDDGVGVSKEELERLQLCGQGDISHKDYEDSGEAAHGYGLKLVKQIVKAHEGEVIFQANTPQGFRVEIYGFK